MDLDGFFRRLFKAESDLSAVIEPGPESEDQTAFIRGCRDRFGLPPRALSVAEVEASRLNVDPALEAAFRKSKDPMLRILADQQALLERGEVVWGRLVQANQILFDASNHYTAPANVIYSLDPYFDGRVASLGAIAHDLFARKGTVPGERELRELARVITDERERIMRRELPCGYCGGRSVYFTTCFIRPGHLPGNRIVLPEFPLLVNFRETEAVIVLPSRFWPADLVAEWLG
jgi:hypothetical protein